MTPLRAQNRTYQIALDQGENPEYAQNMSKELVPILADAVREYYKFEELVDLCGLFDEELKFDQAGNHLQFAKRLITEMDHGNNRRILEALLPSLFVRCSEMVSKTNWERRAYHEEMAARLERLRPLLSVQTAPTEIAVPDGRPFTAKSEIRDLIAKADGDVFLVDAYIGISTLDCFREVPHSIRILTGQQKQSVENGFETALKDFRSEGRKIEVRRHAKLHDRYLIFNDRCWLIGGSIKDAGKKALNVIECLDSKQAIVSHAEKKWREAVIHM
jgi:hypothetical protein